MASDGVGKSPDVAKDGCSREVLFEDLLAEVVVIAEADVFIFVAPYFLGGKREVSGQVVGHSVT
jgi:hypothetical protein